MNHAGEIRRLVELAEPDVRVWTNVGDAHIGHFGSADAIADAKAEILEGAGPATLRRRQRRRPARDGARRGIRRPHRHLRPRQRRPTSARRASRTAVSTARRARVETPVGRRDVDVPLLGPRQSAERAGRHRRGARVRRAARRHRRARGVARPPRRVAARCRACGRRRHARRRLLQLEPGRAATRAGCAGDERRPPAVASRCSARCWSSATFTDRAAPRVAAAAAAAARVDVLVAVGGTAGARARRTRPLRRAWPPAPCATSTTSDAAAAAWSVAACRPGDLVLVKGSRGTRTDLVADRLAAEWA